MPKVEQIPKTEGKITFSEPLNNVFPEAKKIFEDVKINENFLSQDTMRLWKSSTRVIFRRNYTFLLEDKI